MPRSRLSLRRLCEVARRWAGRPEGAGASEGQAVVVVEGTGRLRNQHHPVICVLQVLGARPLPPYMAESVSALLRSDFAGRSSPTSPLELSTSKARFRGVRRPASGLSRRAAAAPDAGGLGALQRYDQTRHVHMERRVSHHSRFWKRALESARLDTIDASFDLLASISQPVESIDAVSLMRL
jgi:hypothetical protein